MTTGSGLLDTIVAATRTAVAFRERTQPIASLERTYSTPLMLPDVFSLMLRTAPAPRIIAECKRRSPSRGILRADYDPAAHAFAYDHYGAAAISVLTEPTFFDGALEHLANVRRAVTLPLLRKDFIVDEYQLHEARANGADAVLLIVAALDQPNLIALHQRAAALGLAVLVEVHAEEEVQRAVDAGARLIGVNNRNLRTLAVDVDGSHRLVRLIPRDVVAISESGLRSRGDLDRLRSEGYRAFLIGERFMTEADPSRAIADLIGASV